ncbi:MAG: LytTR family transcriptional regulator [Phaeodactylibacter sp.]|nr:LytTR family transcriptional regulator [Phaeodactylibacter sp.]
MLDLLTAPYPLRRSTAGEWAYPIGAGAFVALFLIVFQPFGTRAFQSDNKYLFLAGYGIVISGSILLVNKLLPPLMPKAFQEESWTVGKHILFLLGSFSLVFFACYVYKDVWLGRPISWRGFLGFYPIALSVAVFPLTGLVVGDYIRQLKRYSKGAEEANRHFPKKEKESAPAGITFPDENGKTALEASPGQVCFLQAADNYVEVYYEEDGTMARSLIRNSLSAFEELLAPHGFLRCHRSFLVNPARVEKVSGNAQGYRLHFPLAEQPVPVARSRSAEILEKLK